MMNLLLIGVQLGLNLGSFQLFSISTLAVTLADACMVLFIAGAALLMVWRGEELYLHKDASYIFLCGIFFAAMISGITPIMNGSPFMLQQFLKTFSHFLYLWLFTFVCASMRIGMHVWTRTFKIMLVFALFVNIFGIYQIVARAFDLPFAWLTMTNINVGGRAANMEGEMGQLSLQFGNFYRATSIFSEPSSLAGFNVTMLTYILIPFAQDMKQFFSSRLFTVSFFVFSISALFLTFSLTGVFAGGVVFSTILLLGKRKRMMQVLLVFSFAAILIAITDIFVSSYAGISVLDLFGTRITGILDGGQTKETTGGESFFTRLESILIAIDVWADHPVNGIGMGLYAQAPQSIKGGYGFPDSTLAASLAELGLAGFISMVGMISTLCFKLFAFAYNKQKMGRLSPESRRIVAIIPYTLLVLAAGTFTNNSLVNLWLWIGFSMGFAVYFEALREAGESNFIRFRLIKTPLRTYFYKAITTYFAFPSNKT